MSITINHQTNDLSIAGGGAPTLGGSAAGGGAWNLISTTTVTSNVTSVDFTGLTSYDHYVAVVDDIYMSANSTNLEVQILNSGTPDTSAYRRDHYMGNGASWVGSSTTTGSSIEIIRFVYSLDSAKASAVVNISGMNTANRAVVYSTGVSLGSNSRYGPQIASGGNYGNGAVRNGVRFKPSSGNISGGIFALYGISN